MIARLAPGDIPVILGSAAILRYARTTLSDGVI
jgi:hypothetical protein